MLSETVRESEADADGDISGDDDDGDGDADDGGDDGGAVDLQQGHYWKRYMPGGAPHWRPVDLTVQMRTTP